jgi:gas vesicle protein
VRRNWFIAAVVIGIAAIVIAAIAMRLSDDDGPQTTEEWAGDVCTSLSDWRDSITSLADVSGEPLTADTLRDKLREAEDATSDLGTQLRDLGPPDLEEGDDLQQQLDDSAEELESSFDDLRESAEAAVDAPASEFLQQLAGLASDFAALQTAISTTVSSLENANVAEDSKAELQQAFADAPSCQSLQASS